MSLYKKTLLVIGATLIGLVVILYVASRTILMGGFEELETRIAIRDVGRILEAIDADLSSLELLAGDWAAWDDTYEFIEDLNQAYIDSNLVDETFIDARLNLILFIKPDGEIAFGKALDHETGSEVPIPDGILEHLSPDGLLLSHNDRPEGVTGLLMLPEGPMLISSMPILTSQNLGPSRGTMIMGRFLDQGEIDLLSEIAGLPIEMQRYDELQVSSELSAVESCISEGGAICVAPIDDSTLVGLAVMRDVYGDPALILRTVLPRDIHHQGQLSVSYFVLLLVISGLTFGTVVIALINKLVLTRLAKLASDVGRVNESGNPSARVSANGNDELSRLAHAINDMLRTLESSRAELAASESFFKSVFDAIQDGISVLDRNMTIVRVNRWMEQMYSDMAPLVGKQCYQVYQRRDDVCPWCPSMKTFESEGVHTEVVPYPSDSGSDRWIEVSTYPMLDESGKVIGVIEHVKDITERVQAEMAEREQRVLAEALRDIAAALSSTLDFDEVLERILTNIGKVIPHDAANIMLVEGGVARIVRCRGYEERDLVEKVMSLRFRVDEIPNMRRMAETGRPVIIPDVSRHTEWVDIPEAGWVRSYAGVPIKVEERVIGFLNLDSAAPGTFDQDQAERLLAFADQAAIAIQNARLYQELETYSEILEQAVEERTAELRRIKERVETILNNNPDTILLLDSEGKIETANKALADMFGYEPDELYGNTPTALVESGYAEPLQKALCSTIAEGKTRRLEVVARRKDGSTFDADVALSPIKEAGMVVNIVFDLRDISALKEVERMKDAFVSNVSHELRTPISSLKLYHKLLASHPEKYEMYMERLQRETERLELIIEDLLRLSRLDQRRVAVNMEAVDLNALALQYVTDRGPLAERQGLSLTFDAQPDIPRVMADPGLLGQALSIILTNALNYTPAGGKVTVSTKVRVAEGQTWVGFCVDDTGPGIPPDELPHIFERFFRGKVGRESGVAGTGLGLAIVKEIVDLHQGKVEVTSEGIPGKGATFSVWLPVEGSE